MTLFLAGVSSYAQDKGMAVMSFNLKTSMDAVTPNEAYGSEWAYVVEDSTMYIWSRTDSVWNRYSGNQVTTIASSPDTVTITNPVRGDIAYISPDSVYFRSNLAWLFSSGGSGTLNYGGGEGDVAFFDADGQPTGDANLNWDNTAKRLTLNSAASETYPLTITSSAFDGIDFQYDSGSNTTTNTEFAGLNFRARYGGSVKNEVAAITAMYTGNGTTRKGGIVIRSHNNSGLFAVASFFKDSVTIQANRFRAGNYEFNINQDTTGKDGQVMAFNSSTGEIELSGPITLTATATLDFSSTSAQSSADLTITVTGAADGDAVHIGVPNASVNANSNFTGWVSAADTVTIRFNNYSSSAIDPASGTFRAVVTQY